MKLNQEQLKHFGKAKSQGFTPKPKRDRPKPDRSPSAQSEPHSASTHIPQAREIALDLTSQSHDAMNALQASGMQNAAAYVARKQAERNAVVERVSDTIAHLCDPDLLEADIMSAAAAKIAARSNAWNYTAPAVDFDQLFALPTHSNRLLAS
jgi:hypothetical protein